MVKIYITIILCISLVIEMSLPEPTPVLSEEEWKELKKKRDDPEYKKRVRELYKDTKGLARKHGLV